MKKVLSILAIALALSGCVNGNPTRDDYAKAIAKEVGTDNYSYTFQKLEPDGQYLVTFISYEPSPSYSLWLCHPKDNGGVDCDLLLIKHLQ